MEENKFPEVPRRKNPKIGLILKVLIFVLLIAGITLLGLLYTNSNKDKDLALKELSLVQAENKKLKQENLKNWRFFAGDSNGNIVGFRMPADRAARLIMMSGPTPNITLVTTSRLRTVYDKLPPIETSNGLKKSGNLTVAFIERFAEKDAEQAYIGKGYHKTQTKLSDYSSRYPEKVKKINGNYYVFDDIGAKDIDSGSTASTSTEYQDAKESGRMMAFAAFTALESRE